MFQLSLNFSTLYLLVFSQQTHPNMEKKSQQSFIFEFQEPERIFATHTTK